MTIVMFSADGFELLCGMCRHLHLNDGDSIRAISKNGTELSHSDYTSHVDMTQWSTRNNVNA